MLSKVVYPIFGHVVCRLFIYEIPTRKEVARMNLAEIGSRKSQRFFPSDGECALIEFQGLSAIDTL